MNSFVSVVRLRRTLMASVAFALCSVTASAQIKPTTTPAKPMEMEHGHDMQQEPVTGWKELDAFHELMAASWHPASGMNDLAPAKAKAADMAKAAKTWVDSKAPKGCDTPKIKEALTKVNASTQNYAALVLKGSDDATIKAKLGAIHETFEIVEMGCKPETPKGK